MKKLPTIADLKATRPSPVVAEPSTARIKRPKANAAAKGTGQQLMLMVPEDTAKALKVKAAEKGLTVRALVLQALRGAGYPVPAAEITDRRSARG